MNDPMNDSMNLGSPKSSPACPSPRCCWPRTHRPRHRVRPVRRPAPAREGCHSRSAAEMPDWRRAAGRADRSACRWATGPAAPGRGRFLRGRAVRVAPASPVRRSPVGRAQRHPPRHCRARAAPTIAWPIHRRRCFPPPSAPAISARQGGGTARRSRACPRAHPDRHEAKCHQQSKREFQVVRTTRHRMSWAVLGRGCALIRSERCRQDGRAAPIDRQRARDPAVPPIGPDCREPGKRQGPDSRRNSLSGRRSAAPTIRPAAGRRRRRASRS